MFVQVNTVKTFLLLKSKRTQLTKIYSMLTVTYFKCQFKIWYEKKI